MPSGSIIVYAGSSAPTGYFVMVVLFHEVLMQPYLELSQQLMVWVTAQVHSTYPT